MMSGDAGQLYDSIHQEIFTLDPLTRIYPGHEYQGRNNSTVGEEKVGRSLVRAVHG